LKKLLIVLLMSGMTLLAASPTRAIVYSAFIPGGGQLYNKAYIKAGVVIAVQGYLIGSTIHLDNKVDEYRKKANDATDPILMQLYSERVDDYKERRTSNIWWMGITAALSMMDAYVDAHLADFTEEKEKLHLRFEAETLGLEFRF